MSRAPLLLLLLAALLAGPTACSMGEASDDDSSEGKDDDDSAAEEARATPVKVEPVEVGEISETLVASSTVDTERHANVHVEVPGTIEEVRVEEGDRVRAGAVLAVLRNAALVGELERAEASFQRSKDDYESVRSLFEKGFVSKNEYEAASLAHQTARATLEQARETHRARQLTSPIAGTVSLRQVRYGEAVSTGQLAFAVVDLQALRVEVNLPEKDLARLEPGQKARIRSEILADGVEAAGHVERISPVVDPASGTVKVTVAIDPGQAVLRPGMFVAVEIVVDTHAKAQLVPKRAVVYDEGEPFAFVVTAESTVARKPLTLGFTDRDRVEILDGVAPGDQVVVVGQGLLRDGSDVKVVE